MERITKRSGAAIGLCFLTLVIAACERSGPNQSAQVARSAHSAEHRRMMRATAKLSTITVANKTFPADSDIADAVSVTLRTANGERVLDPKADVCIYVSPCDECTLQYRNREGTIVGSISSARPESIKLTFSVDGVLSPSKATIDFVSSSKR